MKTLTFHFHKYKDSLPFLENVKKKAGIHFIEGYTNLHYWQTEYRFLPIKTVQYSYLCAVKRCTIQITIVSSLLRNLAFSKSIRNK